MSTSKPTVYLVDDDKAVRDSYRVLFKSANLPFVSFPSGEDLLERLEEIGLGCLLLDMRLPKSSGLELMEQLREKGMILPILVLTGHADIPTAVQAIKAGAMDYLEKPVPEKQLIERVRKALALSEQWRQIQEERKRIAGRLGKLTPREREVMELMVAGKKNKKIAEELGISRKTLDIHRAKVMSKMEASTVADLVRWSYLDNPSLLPTTLVGME